MLANGFMNVANVMQYSNPNRETVVSTALTERYLAHQFSKTNPAAKPSAITTYFYETSNSYAASCYHFKKYLVFK
jgi:hypothetical protein